MFFRSILQEADARVSLEKQAAADAEVAQLKRDNVCARYCIIFCMRCLFREVHHPTELESLFPLTSDVMLGWFMFD